MLINMKYENLCRLNGSVQIKDIHDSSFTPYGKLISSHDFSDLIAYVGENTQIPEEGNVYEASVARLEAHSLKTELENTFYGEMPVQIGYCNGMNSTLNGLEYHKGSEINIAVTDMILILGKLQDVVNNQYDVKNVEVFYVEKGTALQLYETTLHFSPCKTTISGFKCLVILPAGTNTPLLHTASQVKKDPLLFAKNKWLIAHPSRVPLIQKGAYPGLIGENIEIKIA